VELNAKMRKNLTMARDRVNVLREFLFSLFLSFPPIFSSEGLLRQENDIPVKAQAIPTKAQRPTSPRHIAPPPPVSISFVSVFTKTRFASSLLYINLAIMLYHPLLLLLLQHHPIV
jgi:hypothetical protein